MAKLFTVEAQKLIDDWINHFEEGH